MVRPIIRTARCTEEDDAEEDEARPTIITPTNRIGRPDHRAAAFSDKVGQVLQRGVEVVLERRELMNREPGRDRDQSY